MKGIDKIRGGLTYSWGQGAVIKALPQKPRTTKEQWLMSLIQRIGEKRACIALANKTVRTAWHFLLAGSNIKEQP